MFWTWFCTVRWLSTNRSAIWRYDSPFATRRSTSVSRSVSLGAPASPGAGSTAKRRNSPSTSDASAGESSRSPGPGRVSVTTVQRTVRFADGHAYADAAAAQLRVKQFGTALVYARRAYDALKNTTGDPYLAYASYDVGAALTRLGRCSEALPYLDRASRLEPHTKAVQNMLSLAKSC